MAVKVLYFASLRELLDRAEADAEVDENTTAGELWTALNPSVPAPESCLVAINQDYSDWHAIVTDGDEVAFFPPVTGG